MIAPGVASAILIVCAEAYVPATGEKTGVATGVSMTYLAEATVLLVYPVATAIASMVSVAATEMAAVYLVDAVVGVAPLVV